MSQENHFTLQTRIKDILLEYPDAETCWIAYSGGMDSHVLLHSLAHIKNEIKQELIAVHVNHGISHDAKLWEKHCRGQCKNYAIKFKSFTINLENKNGKGTEALAREERYKIFGDLMEHHDLLLMAHHANDQIETILLQLLRGAGPDGLVGMPQSRKFTKGFLVRPMLDYSRKDIHDYALKESLSWIEDESNQSNKYDRNYLRNKILPEILARWPGLLKTMQRVAQHQVDAKNLIDEISEVDLEAVCDDKYKRINLDEFSNLSFVRKKNVLRAWIKKNEMEIPSSRIIENVNEEVINANVDRNPCIRWEGAEIRRYRNYIYIMRPLPVHDTNMVMKCNLGENIKLSSGNLKMVSDAGNGIKKDMTPGINIEIRYRQGGEKIRPLDRDHAHDLKKIFQEEGVLPWLRDRTPLIFYEDKLIAVGDLWVEHQYAASGPEPSWRINWKWSDD